MAEHSTPMDPDASVNAEPECLEEKKLTRREAIKRISLAVGAFSTVMALSRDASGLARSPDPDRLSASHPIFREPLPEKAEDNSVTYWEYKKYNKYSSYNRHHSYAKYGSYSKYASKYYKYTKYSSYQKYSSQYYKMGPIGGPYNSYRKYKSSSSPYNRGIYRSYTKYSSYSKYKSRYSQNRWF